MSNQPQAHVADERGDAKEVDDTPMRRAFEKAASEHHNEGALKRGLTSRAGKANPYLSFDMNVEWRTWQEACEWQSLAAGAPAETPKLISEEWCQKMASREIEFDGNIEAGAETPKSLTVHQIADIWNATEKEWIAAVKVALDPADAGNLTVHFVRAIERALAAQPAPAPATDAAMLDFVLSNCAWIQWATHDDTFKRCQLLTQGEDEDYIVLSGDEKSFATEREAIDSAMLSANSPREAG